MLAIAGTTMAQDIWSCGSHSNNGMTGVGIYLNGVRVSTFQHSSNNFSAYDITRWGGHTYMAYRNTTVEKAFVWDYESNESISFGDNTTVYKVFGRNGGSFLWAAGYKLNGSIYNAIVWKISAGSATEFYTLTNESYDTYAYCGFVDEEGWVYAGGFQLTGPSAWEGVVWRGNSVLLTIPETKSYVMDMAYYNGDVYSLVRTNASNSVWVYKNSTRIYTITENENSIKDLYIDGGDVYVCGSEGSSLKVWKNGEVIYSTTGTNLYDVFANSEGIYYCGNKDGYGTIWKDGSVLYQNTNCTGMNELYVEAPECANADIRTLPYFEGFERGETDWECWTKVDVDNANGVYATYWDRAGSNTSFTTTTPHTGDNYARHTHHTSIDQEGWLISPRLFLQPGRDNTVLRFYSHRGWTESAGFATVLVSTDNNPNNLTAFNEVYSLSGTQNAWQEVEVDLSDYQGQAIYIAFRYSASGATSAPSWNIDDVSVTEDWDDGGTFPVPYSQEFSTGQEPGYYWYILDNDHTGDLKCWQWDASSECAKHPDGQNNGINQEGWMFTPTFELESGMNYSVTFDTKYTYTSYANNHSSLWIAVDHWGVPDPADFTMIWEETNATTSWVTQTIDLSSYAGHDIRLAFKYEGIYAHVWYLDNFAINAALPQFNINVEANNAAYGTVSGGGTFDQGATCTITATANSGYEFKKWTKDGSDVSTSESYTFTVTEDATYVAVFGEPAVTYYTVSTAANPAAGGTVTGGGTYASGTEVTLTATPNEGYEFVKWNDNNTDNPRTITVTGDVTYTAQFSLKTYNLSVSANPVTGGNVTGGGNYPYGEYVTITATPNEGYQFLNWNDGVTQASRTVRVISDATYVAHFADVTTTTYTVTVVSGDPTMGTVTGGGTYPEGSEITISASPFGTNVFKKWDDDNTDNPRTVTVTADVTYTAIFEAPTLYTITVVSLNPEMGSVSGGGNFPMGAEVTIQANPLGGYYFDGWTDNNYDNPRTVTVTGNATYSAKFSAQQAETFMLTVTCNPMHGYVEGGGNYLSGTNVTVTAVPYDGYEFDHWNDNVTQNPRTVTVSNNMTLVAFFKATGVGENGETVMSLYPNPAKESIRLKGIESNSEVVIYNTLGMMVKTVNANAEQEINVSDLAAGVYTVRCGHQVLRFVKE